jgi:hypothetical protein
LRVSVIVARSSSAALVSEAAHFQAGNDTCDASNSFFSISGRHASQSAVRQRENVLGRAHALANGLQERLDLVEKNRRRGCQGASLRAEVNFPQSRRYVD